MTKICSLMTCCGVVIVSLALTGCPTQCPTQQKNSVTKTTPVPTPAATEIVAGEITVVEPISEPTDSGMIVVEPIAEPTDSGVIIVEPIAEPTDSGVIVVEPIAEPTDSGVIIVEPIEETVVVVGETVVEPIAETVVAVTPVEPAVAEMVVSPLMADLDAVLLVYVERVEKAAAELQEAQDFAADSEAFVRDSSALALLALAAGLQDGSQHKKVAASVVAASVDAMKAADAAAAVEAAARIKTAVATEADPSTLGWTKVVPLAPVMKAVPNISSAVNRSANTESKLKRAGQRVVEGIAAMAAIVQGSVANVSETVQPEAEVEWQAACHDFRDKAIAANTAAHKFLDGVEDYAAFDAAFTAMNDSCNICHKTFHPTGVTTDAANTEE